MCDCLICGAYNYCRDGGCTNDECPDCRETREEAQRNERGEDIEQMPGERR